VIGLATDAEVDELMRRAQDAGGDIVFKAENQTWGPVPADDDLAQTQSSDAYAGAFTDPDGHMWQVTRADGVLIRGAIRTPVPLRFRPSAARATTSGAVRSVRTTEPSRKWP
jgi:hypothetical protein